MDNIILEKFYEEPKNKYNIMSVCVFRLKHSYKSTEKYYKGLEELITFFPKIFPNFYLRLYFDNSIIKPEHDLDNINREVKNNWIPLIEKMKELNFIQLIRYEHPDFIIDNGLYHKGVFGTLVRFLPLFEKEDNIDNVIIGDVDTDKIFLNKQKRLYDIFIKSNSSFHFRTRYCYFSVHRYRFSEKYLNEKYKPNTYYRITANTIFSKIKFPKRLLNDFINCTQNQETKDCNYINNFKRFKSSKAQKDDDIFYYGIDEFFLNTVFLKYIENNNIKSSISIKNDFNLEIYRIHYDDIVTKKSEDKNLKYFYKNVMKEYYDKNKTLAENFKLFDKITYKDKGKVAIYFLNNMKEFLKKLNDDDFKKYNFNKRRGICFNLIKSFDDVLFEYLDFDKTKIITGGQLKYLDCYYKYKSKYLDEKNKY